jgi:hypothetical protein
VRNTWHCLSGAVLELGVHAIISDHQHSRAYQPLSNTTLQRDFLDLTAKVGFERIAPTGQAAAGEKEAYAHQTKYYVRICPSALTARACARIAYLLGARSEGTVHARRGRAPSSYPIWRGAWRERGRQKLCRLTESVRGVARVQGPLTRFWAYKWAISNPARAQCECKARIGDSTKIAEGC